MFFHPFSNGNGGHARIMADAVLTKVLNEKAIDWADGYRLEAMNECRNQYIAAQFYTFVKIRRGLNI